MNIAVNKFAKIVFRLSLLLILTSNVYAQSNEDDIESNQCPDASIKGALRNYFQYSLSVNDDLLGSGDDANDDSDFGEEKFDDTDDSGDEDSGSEIDLEALNNSLSKLSKDRFFFAKAPESLLGVSKKTLNEFKSFDSLDWKAASLYSSEDFPSALESVFENDNCRELRDIASLATPVRLRRLNRVSLNSLSKSLKLISELSETLSENNLISDKDFRSSKSLYARAESNIRSALRRTKR
jgi:hypothetical protein